ncbi:hypothetical protein DXV76_00225 [Rhodobacteraceae bacterium CCMM004]|nr:hypothetical protein DXV76_00225 [Rhodobacteraceae bacterium CCMM004]
MRSSENDTCVVRTDLEKGQLATDEPPVKTAAVRPGAAALGASDVDMACGGGGGLRRVKEHGNALRTGAG